MELSIQKWGNSAAVRLPASLLDQLDLELGDKLAVDVRREGMMLKPARREYTLESLVSQCDPRAPISDEDTAWDAAKPVGREVW
ncbi:MAG TPA: AbrB/MazE/SpoVT family DNA-binding domain-containing protein [Pararobbsia sp.]|nr:AbrB/MazE/SpoVT family DNA-binding domain-containing protein [Pararobbsia sp.]